jgi:hypothetical protein
VTLRAVRGSPGMQITTIETLRPDRVASRMPHMPDTPRSTTIASIDLFRRFSRRSTGKKLAQVPALKRPPGRPAVESVVYSRIRLTKLRSVPIFP